MIIIFYIFIIYRQQLCNQRKNFFHNVETNNKGILHLQDVRGAWRSISGPRLWIPEFTRESQVGRCVSRVLVLCLTLQGANCFSLCFERCIACSLLVPHSFPLLCEVDVSYETPPFNSVLCFLP